MTTIRTATVAAAGLVMLTVVRAHAADVAPDRVWLVSTREAPLPEPDNGGDAQISYWRLKTDELDWQAADATAFYASDDPAVPTVVFIHGNRIGRHEAVDSGWSVYQQFCRQAGGLPFRFVIWSWPADRIRGRNRRDVRVKACHSDVQSYYLAQCIDRMDPAVPINLVGYSFGARVITGALHMIAGGQIAGRSLRERDAPVQRAQVRAVLVAAALDNDWLLPDRRNGLALGQLDRVLITQNASDPVLRWYPLMHHVRGPQALGYAGPACPEQLGPGQEKIEALKLGCPVGRNHTLDSYLSTPALQSRLAWYAFLESPLRETRSTEPVLPVSEPPSDRPSDSEKLVQQR